MAFCPADAQRRTRQHGFQPGCIFKFRARFTDGTTGFVHGKETMNEARVSIIAKEIARRNDVQSVKVVSVPTNR